MALPTHFYPGFSKDAVVSVILVQTTPTVITLHDLRSGAEKSMRGFHSPTLSLLLTTSLPFGHRSCWVRSTTILLTGGPLAFSSMKC